MENIKEENQNTKDNKSNKIYLSNKLEVAKFVKYVITDLLNEVSKGSMFVYNGYVYNTYIK